MPEPADAGLLRLRRRAVDGRARPTTSPGMDGHRRRARRAQASSARPSATSALDRPPGRRADLWRTADVLDALAAEHGRRARAVRLGAARRARAWSRDLLAPRTERFVELLDSSTGTVAVQPAGDLRRGRGAGRGRAGEPGDRRAAASAPETFPRTRCTPTWSAWASWSSRALERQARGRQRPCCSTWSLPLVRDSAACASGGVDHVLDVALLVDRDAVATSSRTRWRTLAEAVHERIRLQLTGPAGAVRLRRRMSAWA